MHALVPLSYISPGIRALEDEIKQAGIVVMNEIGLDPGVDHLYAIKTIDEVHAKGGKVSADVVLSCLHMCSSLSPYPRLRSSIRTVVASRRPSAPGTPSGTSSPGPRAAGSSRCLTTPRTSRVGSRLMCPGRT